MAENRKFTMQMTKTYLSATLGNMFSNLASAGIKGSDKPADLTDTMLGGMQVGTAFIAYPVALNMICKHCPYVRAQRDSPNGKKWVLYTAGGAGAAAILTAVNYPLNKVRESRKSKEAESPSCTVREACSFYVDSIGSSIGFAATMGTLAPRIPTTGNSLINWGRGAVLVTAANIGGSICSWPIKKLKYNKSLTGMILGNIKAMPGFVMTGDGQAHFSRVLGFLTD